MAEIKLSKKKPDKNNIPPPPKLPNSNKVEPQNAKKVSEVPDLENLFSSICSDEIIVFKRFIIVIAIAAIFGIFTLNLFQNSDRDTIKPSRITGLVGIKFGDTNLPSDAELIQSKELGKLYKISSNDNDKIAIDITKIGINTSNDKIYAIERLLDFKSGRDCVSAKRIIAKRLKEKYSSFMIPSQSDRWDFVDGSRKIAIRSNCRYNRFGNYRDTTIKVSALDSSLRPNIVGIKKYKEKQKEIEDKQKLTNSLLKEY